MLRPATLWVIVLAGLIGHVPVCAQQSNPSPQDVKTVTPAMRAEANDFFQHQDWQKAAQAYALIAGLEPKNGGALNRLGASLHSLGNYQGAVDAFRRSVEITRNPTTMYNLGCAYARLNDKAKALEWLKKAVQGGFNQLEQMRDDADLASLREDPSFRELLSAEVNVGPCAAAEHRQFDFWIGEWTVKAKDGQVAGTNSVRLILRSCVLFENWTPSQGSSGKSFSFYNKATRRWQQTWVDDEGRTLEFKGEFSDNAMRFITAEQPLADGGRGITRMTLFNTGPNHVRQLGESSSDGGKTWRVQFDLVYERKK